MSSLPDFLLLEEDPFMARKLVSIGQQMGFFCVVASNTRQGRMHLDIHGNNLRMVALSLSATDPLRIQLFYETRRKYPQLPVMLLSGPETLTQAAAARSKGSEYLVKPFDLETFQSVVTRLTSGEREAEVPFIEATVVGNSAMPMEPSREIPMIIGSSPGILEVFEKLGKIGRQRNPVILIGEPGTGKSLVGEILHTSGPTKLGGMVKVDCASDKAGLYTLIFGSDTESGAVASVPNGTLVLENINFAPPEVQSALLNLMEQGTYRPQNSNQVAKATPRMLFTTEVDLAELTTQGLFRQDLYFRITEAPIYLPTLSERKTDIPALARRFLRRHENPEILGFDEACWPQLLAYQWPGNLDELDRVVQHAMQKCVRGHILPQHLPALLEAGQSLHLQALRQNLSNSLGDWLDERLKCRPASYDAIAGELEAALLERLLRKYDGKPTFLADALDVNRNTLRKKLEISGLGKKQNRKPSAPALPAPSINRSLAG